MPLEKNDKRREGQYLNGGKKDSVDELQAAVKGKNQMEATMIKEPECEGRNDGEDGSE